MLIFSFLDFWKVNTTIIRFYPQKKTIFFIHCDDEKEVVIIDDEEDNICDPLLQMDDNSIEDIDEPDTNDETEQEIVDVVVNGVTIKNVANVKLNKLALTDVEKEGLKKMEKSDIKETRYRYKCRKKRERNALCEELYSDLNKESSTCDITKFIQRVDDTDERVFSNTFCNEIKNMK